MRNSALQVPASYSILEGMSGDAIAPEELAKIRRILAHAMGPGASPAGGEAPLWSDDLLKLDRSSLFRSLPLAAQAEVRRATSIGLLKEAQMIEVAGMVFTAKMALLARNLEERELYSLFAADEARHFHLISKWAGPVNERDGSGNPFLDLLSDLIRFEERPVLVFLIQVVLEGWGIHHYSRLARAAQSSDLGQAFQEILRDEAQHHGSGLLLFNENDLSDEAAARLSRSMAEFLRLVRLGPGSVLAKLAEHGASIDEGSIRLFLEETDAVSKVQTDLAEIESLIKKVEGHRLLERLRQSGLLTPPTIHDLTHGLRMGLTNESPN